MNATMLLARVQDHLDARTDPFDDATVLAGLAGHPELLEVVVGLRAAAREVAAGRTAAPRRRVARWALVLGAGASAAAATVLTLSTTSPDAADPARRGGRIVAASLEEIRPHAHVAAQFVVTDPGLATATARLETWTTRSTQR